MKKYNVKLIFSPSRLAILLLINLIISFIVLILSDHSNQMSKFKIFQLDWIYSNCIGFSIYFFLHILHLFELKKVLKLILVFLAVILGSIGGGVLGSSIISYFYGYKIFFFKSTNLFYFLPVSLVFGFSAYTIFILLGRIHKRKIQWLEEKQIRTQIELTSLRTRINPHFLFNTLNSISGLIYSAPAKADDMLQKLSELLRYNLNAADVVEIDLNLELEVVADYLTIEKIRFAHRLEFNITNSVSGLKFPPLILLTLVENAIKHGIAKSIEGGKIAVDVWQNSNEMVLSVFNTGTLLNSKFLDGFGLKALKRLLDIHYQGKAAFKLVEHDNGTLAKIVIQKGKEI